MARAAVQRPLGHLRAVTRLPEVPVEEPGGDTLAEHVEHGRQPDVDLSPPVVGRPVDRVCRDLGLVDRRNGLRLLRQLRPPPRELGRVEAGEMHHRHVDVPAVVADLGDHRLREALARVLRAAVGRLERDAAEGERRADLDDRAAVPLRHPPQRGLRPPDHAVVGDVGGAPILVRLDVEELRIDRRHRIVDPDVDGAELALRRLRRRLDLLGVGDVGWKDEGLAAAFFDLSGRGFEPGMPAGEERDLRAVLGEPARGCAADPAGGAGDHDDVAHASRSSGGPRSQTSCVPTCREPRRCLRRSARTPGRPVVPGTAPRTPDAGAGAARPQLVVDRVGDVEHGRRGM